MRIPVRNPTWATFSPAPPWKTQNSPRSARQRQGLKYEQAAQKHFAELFPNWRAGQWIHFQDDSGLRWCQPDGFAEFDTFVLLVEFKYQHTSEAWEQLRLIYAPLLEFLLGKRIVVLETVKWFDPLIQLPEPIELVANPTQWTGNSFGIHIWKP